MISDFAIGSNIIDIINQPSQQVNKRIRAEARNLCSVCPQPKGWGYLNIYTACIYLY